MDLSLEVVDPTMLIRWAINHTSSFRLFEEDYRIHSIFQLPILGEHINYIKISSLHKAVHPIQSVVFSTFVYNYLFQQSLHKCLLPKTNPQIPQLVRLICPDPGHLSLLPLSFHGHNHISPTT